MAQFQPKVALDQFLTLSAPQDNVMVLLPGNPARRFSKPSRKCPVNKVLPSPPSPMRFPDNPFCRGLRPKACRVTRGFPAEQALRIIQGSNRSIKLCSVPRRGNKKPMPPSSLPSLWSPPNLWWSRHLERRPRPLMGNTRTAPATSRRGPSLHRVMAQHLQHKVPALPSLRALQSHTRHSLPTILLPGMWRIHPHLREHWGLLQVSTALRMARASFLSGKSAPLARPHFTPRPRCTVPAHRLAHRLCLTIAPVPGVSVPNQFMPLPGLLRTPGP